MSQNKIYVGNLPFKMNDDDLRELFSKYGDIEDLRLIMDRETGRSKGYAFITFTTQEAAQNSLEMRGREIEGRTIRVNMAKEDNRRSGGGSRRR